MNVNQLLAKKQAGEKIVVITAYDYPGALLAEQAGADIVLVGDSLGNVVLGYEKTTAVTVADILHHTKPVARAIKKALVVADMPFGSYQISTEQALSNAIRFIKEGGAAAVKLEVMEENLPLITSLTKQGIPVMAHIGLLPQTASLWHGYRCQGRDAASAHTLMKIAGKLEEAGAFSVVLECVAAEAAAAITASLKIPTIGIGAGAECDGQVLVFHDLVGLSSGYLSGLGNGYEPRFVKRYGDAASLIRQALSDFATEVRGKIYPDNTHSFFMEAEELKKL